MPIDSQEIHSSIYFDANTSANHLNSENRSASIEAANASYELPNTYSTSSLIGMKYIQSNYKSIPIIRF